MSITEHAAGVRSDSLPNSTSFDQNKSKNFVFPSCKQIKVTITLMLCKKIYIGPSNDENWRFERGSELILNVLFHRNYIFITNHFLIRGTHLKATLQKCSFVARNFIPIPRGHFYFRFHAAGVRSDPLGIIR